MKKLLFTLLVVAFVFNTQAQEENSSGSKWQARFRVVTVIPSPDDDIDGANVDISTSVIPEVDFTYFFNENWAAELILGTTKHNVDLDIDGGGSADLGHVWLLPPTLTMQYHFTGGKVKPYLGAGFNYTIFYGVDAGDLDDIEYDNAFGFAFQGGFDYDLNDKWFLNLDVKQVLLKTDVTVNNSSDSSEVTINPLLVGVGVGLKF